MHAAVSARAHTPSANGTQAIRSGASGQARSAVYSASRTRCTYIGGGDEDGGEQVAIAITLAQLQNTLRCA